MAALEAKFIGKLSGHVALVTGASRGLGKGIAEMLGQAGATVYITGRSLGNGPGSVGTISETAELIRSAGGKCIPLQCDHGNDEDVKHVFDTISREQDGRLDILVNNAFAGVKFLMKESAKPFFEMPLEGWDAINRVGLRSNYVCAYYAAQLMVPRKKGLIVNISSAGGLSYLFTTAYGVGKEGNDRMAADMAIELKKYNVAAISLWPGPVKTELVKENLDAADVELTFRLRRRYYVLGKGYSCLGCRSESNAEVWQDSYYCGAGHEYGFKDVGGVTPPSVRQLWRLVHFESPKWSWMIPSFIYVPKWLYYLFGQKL